MSLVSIATRPLPEPKPSAIQSSAPSRSTVARCVPKIQAFSRQPLRADVAQARVLADRQLDDGVQQAVGVVVGGDVLLPDLGRGALLEHDERAPLQRGLALRLHDGDDDRRLDRHAARDVDERAALPARLVARDERVLGVDDRAEVLLDELRVLLHGEAQRQHDDAVGGRLGRAVEGVVDLLQARRALRRVDDRQRRDVEMRADPLGLLEGVEVELLQRRELPARVAAELRQREGARQTDGALAARRQPSRLDQGPASQLSPPSAIR